MCMFVCVYKRALCFHGINNLNWGVECTRTTSEVRELGYIVRQSEAQVEVKNVIGSDILNDSERKINKWEKKEMINEKKSFEYGRDRILFLGLKRG